MYGWEKRRAPVSLLLGGALLLSSCQSPSPTSPDATPQKSVTILGSLTGVGEEKLLKSLEPFSEATGIEVVYEGTDAFATLVAVRVDSGDPPDMALFPQPGLMQDFAQAGDMVPLTDRVSRADLEDAYDSYLLDLVSVEDDVYGLWMRADVKSLVWYSPQAFAEKGYAVPETWDELEALSDRIVADGGVPWCIGMESGTATGWVGTDWIEDILLRQSGPEVYDQWVNHTIPFTDSRVKAAFETFGEIVRDPKMVRGGVTGVVGTPFGESPIPLFEQSPGCYMHRQASFIGEFLPEALEPGTDVNVFPLPPMGSSQGQPVLMGGIVFGAFNDTPEVKALMQYLATPEPHQIWAGLGSYISPHQQVALDAYPNVLIRRQAEILRNADVIRFDGSDQMPGAVGSGTFWTSIVDYAAGEDVNATLKTIDESWPEAN